MDKQFDFWQDHSDTFLTMAYLWDRRSATKNPDGFGQKTGECGDTIALYLRIDNDVISEVAFEIEGCLNTNACCNALAVHIEGQETDNCWDISTETLINFLETLPADHYHCAELTIGTFYLALADYTKKKQPHNKTSVP